MGFLDYKNQAIKCFRDLLSSNAAEKSFQEFFEKHPSFLLGAYEVKGGTSGHSPYYGVLFSQPVIINDTLRADREIKRLPDFLWLANNSKEFCPVFVEIESLTKKYFKGQKNHSFEFLADFNQAYGQIEQWKVILESENGRNSFFEKFKIPKILRDKKFRPQYCLVYGCRDEYKDDAFRTNMIAGRKTNDIDVMPYDRILEHVEKAFQNYIDFYTVKRKGEENVAINIPPSFRFHPLYYKGYNVLEENSFFNAVDSCNICSERKEFLKKRFLEKWKTFKPSSDSNILSIKPENEYYE